MPILMAFEEDEARYLVIVAPSLPPSPADERFPFPNSPTRASSLPNRGLPDLKNINAFVANGSQAITYGPGTWHAPMAVVGKRPIDFVVVQFANGVGIEDCQEVEVKSSSGEPITVAIRMVETRRQGLWKL